MGQGIKGEVMLDEITKHIMVCGGEPRPWMRTMGLLVEKEAIGLVRNLLPLI
jgi:hypothetical protein